MPHRDALPTGTGRPRPARCVVEGGWALRRAGYRVRAQLSATHMRARTEWWRPWTT
ncbi:hypothetical protein OHT57_43620 [Streptomyces sp. NBC_00285]|uniref:hypothetical protein n=1 Tax=Streptomyces sp. NBC_00285 TaxID=2975700 RepID=UPI002E2CEF26|nr:hypothetical protein [Streptomyces sp. NBC_00285]